MSTPFWQQSLETMSFAELKAFIDLGTPEGDNLEYKRASLNTKSQKPYEFDHGFLKTIVSFANGAGGLLIYGIEEDGKRGPKEIEGEPPVNGKLRDLGKSLQGMCMAQMEPRVSMGTTAIEIPAGEAHAGSQVLLVQVRRGLLTPYSLRGHGIFLRGGQDGDYHASVREIHGLFDRRQETVRDEEQPWHEVRNAIFMPLNVPNPKQAPYVMIALTPAFPIEPITLTVAHDEAFRFLGHRAFMDSGKLYREASGVSLVYPDAGPEGPATPMAMAYNDGTIGMRVALYSGEFWAGGRPPLRVDLTTVWRRFREMLQPAADWPREQCGYTGSLVCRLGVGNLSETYGAVDDGVVNRFTHTPQSDVVPNRQVGWPFDTEWDYGVEVDDVIETALGSLARQLQFAYFDKVKAWMRSAAAQ